MAASIPPASSAPRFSATQSTSPTIAAIAKAEIQKVIITQVKDGVDIRVAFRDEFPAANAISGRDTNVPWDFAIYDEQVATEVFPQAGKYYGRKTTQAAEIEKYLRYYQLVEHSAHAVVVDGDRLTLAAESLALAS